MRIFPYIIFIFQTLFISPVLAQNSEQDWINFSQSYYKIKVGSKGVHRITQSQLQTLGAPVNTLDPRSFQIFYRGAEIAIRVVGESDGSFDTNDFIEFVAKPNDGERESELYDNPALQPHTYYSLYSDSSSYFLTWRLDGSRGRRMEVVPFVENVSALPAIESYVQENLRLFTNQASTGRTYPRGNSTRKSVFDLGEGFTGTAFVNTQSDFIIDNLPNRAASGTFNLEVLLQGRNNNPHQTEVFVGPTSTNLRSLGTVNYNAFEFVRFSREINPADFNANGSLVVRLIAQPTNNLPDRISVSYIKVNYAREMTIAGENRLFMELLPQAVNQSFFQLSNVPTGSRLFDITDFKNPRIVNTQIQSGVMRTVLNNSQSTRRLYVEGPGFVTANIERVNFRDYNNVTTNYLIITHPILRRASQNYNDPVRAFAAYRASQIGGSYDTLVVDVPNLYNQFNYGEVSPKAITNFVRFLHDKSPLEYLFLVGNGLNWFHNFYRANDPFNNTNIRFKDFVPPSGFPGSDALYSSSLPGGNNIFPVVATGRFTAQNAQDVESFLEKVKAMESQEIDDLWRKRHVLLSGGVSLLEVSLFRTFSLGFGSRLQGPYLGGDWDLVAKRTNNSIEVINIAERVNSGLQQITFFGHSGTQQTDIDIGFVSAEVNGYNNRDKYPFILINGCNAGEIFSNQLISFGEDWMKTANRGAIAVMAHSAEGFSTELRKFTNLWFETAYGDSAWIYQSIGKVHQEVMRRYIQNEGANFLELDLAQIQQMILQADPAYRLFPTKLPDYTIAEGSVNISGFLGEAVTARSDSFLINFVVKNYGRTVDDSLQIQVNRVLPNGQRISLPIEGYLPVLNTDTLAYVVRDNSEAFFGRNLFEIVLDPDNIQAEINEQNNSSTLDFFLPLSGTKNAYPYPFSFVGDQSLRLIAHSTDLLSPERGYLLEIDTSANFDSPWKISRSIRANVLFESEVNLLSQDSLTYFWRTKFEQAAPEEIDDWLVSSFTYTSSITEGWIQNRKSQINTQNIRGLELINQKWVFQESEFDLVVNLFRSREGSSVSIVVNDLELNATAPCARNTLNLLAFNRSSGDAYRVLTSGGFDVLDPLSCGRRPQVINQIRNNQISNPDNFLHAYLDGIPTGDYVLLVSNDSVNLQQMVALSANRLLELGASMSVLNQLQNGDLYLLFGRMGSSEGEAIEIHVPAQGLQSPINLAFDEEVSVAFSDGEILSNRIGPSRGWDRVKYSIETLGSVGSASVSLYGINAAGNSVLLFQNMPSDQDISSISAIDYPFLQLKFETEDTQNQQALQLVNWMISYQTVAEGIILPDRTFYTQQIELAEGLDFSIPYRFKNKSNKDYTSELTIESRFSSISSGLTNTASQKVAPPSPNAEVNGSLVIDTRSMVGRHNLRLSAFPESVNEEHDRSNNQFNVNQFLRVLGDSLAPVLQVTFDGISILDGDIVSPNPLISIRMIDENPILQKSDTAGVELFLRKACEDCVFERISLNSKYVSIHPATDDSDFRIDYKPEGLENGIHTLRVNVNDESNNAAGDDPLVVNFEVINESTITHFYPYPNPFSSSTRFVFTLTGTDIPEEIKIQIMTVTGRVVREILQDELGPIRVGNNISEYAWDGRDEFGDQLANGVYLYRVLVRKNGQYMEQRATSADKAFKKGYGKLYILR